MNRFLSVIVLVLFANIAWSQSITIEDKVIAKAGRMASVTIKSDGKTTSWIALPSDGVDIFREYDPDISIIRLRLLSYANGTYYIVASTTLNDKIDIKTCTVIVGDPIIPIPIIPINTDTQLIKNLKAVYAADSSNQRAIELDALIALYDQGSVFVNTRPDLKTYGQVWDSFRQVSKTLGCSGKLIAVQQLIQNEMQIAGIPMSPADGSTIVDKLKLVTQLQRIASLLKQVK